MLRLAAQMVRFRKGSFVATLVALTAGVAILMTCALLVESGWRHQGQPQRYGAALAVVADREMTVAGPTMFGETEYSTLALPERGSVAGELTAELAEVPGVARAVGDRSIAVTTSAAPEVPTTGHGWASAALAPYRLVSGGPPRSGGEIAVDTRLADRAGLAPGDTTDIVTAGESRPYRVSGVVESDGAAGERAALFFTDARAAAVDPRPGRFD
ncbi:ABC transporter permease, partial [Streptomyces sp. NPDC004976]